MLSGESFDTLMKFSAGRAGCFVHTGSGGLRRRAFVGISGWIRKKRKVQSSKRKTVERFAGIIVVRDAWIVNRVEVGVKEQNPRNKLWGLTNKESVSDQPPSRGLGAKGVRPRVKPAAKYFLRFARPNKFGRGTEVPLVI